MFTNIYDARDILRVVERMKDVAGKIGKEGMKTIVIGMPNTGKSSMLNVIRRHATDRKCTLNCKMSDRRESGQDVKSGRSHT